MSVALRFVVPARIVQLGIAIDALVDPVTVRRYFLGAAMQSMTVARIERVLDKRKMAHRPEVPNARTGQRTPAPAPAPVPAEETSAHG